MYARLRRPTHTDFTGNPAVILEWAKRYGVDAVELSFDWAALAESDRRAGGLRSGTAGNRTWYPLRQCDIPHLQMLARQQSR